MLTAWTADAEADYLNGEDGNDIIYLTGRDMTDSGAGADTYWVMTGRNNHIWDTGTDTQAWTWSRPTPQ